MSENYLIQERFNLIIDHFSTIELDQCVESVIVESFVRFISKQHKVAYSYSDFKNMPKPYWKLDYNRFSVSRKSVKDTILFIDKFMESGEVREMIFDSVVITVDLSHHDIRYKQYLYDLSLSIRDQIGIEFSMFPTIPHIEDNFSVGFSLMSNDEIISLSNSIIDALEKLEEEKKLDQMVIKKEEDSDILLRDQVPIISFDNPFQEKIISPSGDSNGYLVNQQKRNSFFKWLFKW